MVTITMQGTCLFVHVRTVCLCDAGTIIHMKCL